jgi:malate dehydrogenase (oxaloacetate-decarboxylating)
MTHTDIIVAYKKQGSRIETKARVKLREKKDFSLWYTPGVGSASLYLAKHPKDARKMSIKQNSVAIVSDGSAVLGLGNIGPYGALPVMEGKALIFKEKGGVDAWPLVLDLAPLKLRGASPQEEIDFIIQVVKAVAPNFGGINLEDIKAPACFEVERRLVEELDIPVMHDDQHGTAIVVLAGLINAAKVVEKSLKSLRVVISGAGAAGTAVAKLLLAAGVKDIVMLDRTGVISASRANLNAHKAELARLTNPRQVSGGLVEAMTGADAFVGVSGKGILKGEHVALMSGKGIVFALANPDPEILPDVAWGAGAEVVATGRSDFANQINNALVFPGVFRGALDKGVKEITEATKLRAARALAALVKKPTAEKIIPDLLDARVVGAVAGAVR